METLQGLCVLSGAKKGKNIQAKHWFCWLCSAGKKTTKTTPGSGASRVVQAFPDEVAELVVMKASVFVS